MIIRFKFGPGRSMYEYVKIDGQLANDKSYKTVS